MANIEKCSEKHIALFCLSDINSYKAKTKGYQCVCLACDQLINIKENIQEMKNVVFRQTDQDPFMEYMDIVRNKYRNYISEGLTSEEAVEKLNIQTTNSNDKPKTFKKTTNN